MNTLTRVRVIGFSKDSTAIQTIAGKTRNIQNKTLAALVPLCNGDWIVLKRNLFVGVDLLESDSRIQIEACENVDDLDRSWNKFLIDTARLMVTNQARALSRRNNLLGLRNYAKDCRHQRKFADAIGNDPCLIPGFGDLDAGTATFVPFFTNGTTPETALPMVRENGRYVLQFGGARSERRKINGMWAARLWDDKNRHEVLGSRFYSWDLESAISAVACVFEDLEN